ncbi:MAG: hypothetical protein K6F94_07840 [Bacteroidaceae bacterium]|nr:hypothetical protein [Bacteroidaceae bacterium]
MIKTTKRALPRRRAGILCRCTPSDGIIAMHPRYSQKLYDAELPRLLKSRNPGFISAHAIDIGETLSRTGRPRMALRLMNMSLRHLIAVDSLMQEDYSSKHFWPWNPDFFQWYHPWSARVSEVDARRLAACIDMLQDEVFRHLGHKGSSRLRFSIHGYYEEIFNYIYEVS